MKRIAIITSSLFLFLSLSSLQAQENKAGIKGGANYSNLTGDDVSGTTSRLKYHIGGFATIAVTEFFALQPELLYSTKGADTDGGELYLSTLDVPFLAKIYLSDNFNIHAGPQLGVMLNAEQEINDEREDVKKQFRDLYLEGVLGLEFVTEAGLNFGARYNYSLSTIGDDYESSVTVGNVTATSTVEAPDVRNSVLQLFVGFSF
tara:strand:+ start:26015 stop:26626 length:612 start_codon:yes stop_codon:yes gene_type:complete